MSKQRRGGQGEQRLFAHKKRDWVGENHTWADLSGELHSASRRGLSVVVVNLELVDRRLATLCVREVLGVQSKIILQENSTVRSPGI